MEKILVVVDMQNDFIDGSIANPNVRAIIPNINDKIKDFKDSGNKVVFTLDTHMKNYLETQEGINLPIPHCIIDTWGWEISDDINIEKDDDKFFKHTFGSLGLVKYLELANPDEVELCGTVSSICVISNALLIKAFLPELKISVDVRCIAGLDDKDYNASIEVMRTCQINLLGDE